MNIKCYEESTAQLGSVLYGVLKSELDDLKTNRFLQRCLASWSYCQIAEDCSVESPSPSPAKVKKDISEVSDYLIEYIQSSYPWASAFGKPKIRGIIRESMWLYVAHANDNIINASILSEMDLLFSELPSGKTMVIDTILSWVRNLSEPKKGIISEQEIPNFFAGLNTWVILDGTKFSINPEKSGIIGRISSERQNWATLEKMAKLVEEFLASVEQKPQVHVFMPDLSETLSQAVINELMAKFNNDMGALIAEFEDGVKMAQDIASSNAPDSIKGTARHRLEIIRQRAINGNSYLSFEDFHREVVNLCATSFVDESLYINVFGVIEARELPKDDVCGLRSGQEGTNALYCREFVDSFGDNISGILAKKFKELTGRERGSVVLQGGSEAVVLTVAQSIVSCERLAEYNYE